MSTLVAYAEAADGHIKSVDGFDDISDGWDGAYDMARSGTGSPGLTVVGSSLAAGQYNSLESYYEYGVFEGFVSFDTSSLGAGATVSAAVLALWCSSGTVVAEVQARLRDWGATLEAADWLTGGSGATLVAHRGVTGWTTTAYMDFVDDALPANVNQTGSTRLLIIDKRTVDNIDNGSIAYFYASEEAGTTKDPKLTVTYTTPPAGASALSARLVRTA